MSMPTIPVRELHVAQVLTDRPKPRNLFYAAPYRTRQKIWKNRVVAVLIPQAVAAAVYYADSHGLPAFWATADRQLVHASVEGVQRVPEIDAQVCTTQIIIQGLVDYGQMPNWGCWLPDQGAGGTEGGSGQLSARGFHSSRAGLEAPLESIANGFPVQEVIIHPFAIFT